MKITKTRLKKLILEEIETDPALLDAISALTKSIDGLDISIDFLSSAVTGESGVSIGAAQSQLGRAYKPKVRVSPVQELEEQFSASIEEENRVQNALIDYIHSRKQMGMEDYEALKTEVMEMLKTAYAHRGQDLYQEEEKNNPWAICTASVGREDKQKYEKCVMDVKRKTKQ